MSRINFSEAEYIRFRTERNSIKANLMAMSVMNRPRPSRRSFKGRCLAALTEKDADVRVDGMPASEFETKAVAS